MLRAECHTLTQPKEELQFSGRFARPWGRWDWERATMHVGLLILVNPRYGTHSAVADVHLPGGYYKHAHISICVCQFVPRANRKVGYCESVTMECVWGNP